MASLFENNNKKLSAPRFTYSRKRPIHREIPGVENLCRLCLEKCEKDKATPIFTESSNNISASLALRIMICVGLELTQDECLPNQVCPECLIELERCYKFRKKCEASFSKLKSHVLAVQMKDYKKVTEEKKPTTEVDEGPTAFVYMINMDGSIKLCGEVPAINQDKLVMDVPKEDSMDAPLQIAEPVTSENDANLANKTIENDLINVETVNNSKSNERISIRQDSSTLETNEKGTEIVVDNKNNSSLLKCMLEVLVVNNKPKPASTEEDLSKLLMDVLTDTLTVGRQGDRLVVGMVPRVEITSGDGAVVMMEVVEEDDDEATRENNTSTMSLVKEVADDASSKGVSSRECGECGRVFSCLSAARRHWRAAHRRLRPFQCSVCHRAFAQKEVCRRHEFVHKETRPHVCHKCNKSFTQRLGLEAHLRSHEAPQKRPMMLHPCPHCDKVFLHSSGVSRHVALHMGRQYPCGGCARLFSDGSALRRHCKNTGHLPQHHRQDLSQISHPDARKPQQPDTHKPDHPDKHKPQHPDAQKSDQADEKKRDPPNGQKLIRNIST